MNFQSVDTADQCRFSRTRRPADDNDIAGIDIQTHRVEGLKITKVFRQSVNMDQRSVLRVIIDTLYSQNHHHSASVEIATDAE